MAPVLAELVGGPHAGSLLSLTAEHMTVTVDGATYDATTVVVTPSPSLAEPATMFAGRYTYRQETTT